MNNRPLSCNSDGIDKYCRMLAVCSVDGVDINAWMVSEGFTKPSRAVICAHSSVATKETMVEIELLNGRKLRVGANIDPDILARLVAALDK